MTQLLERRPTQVVGGDDRVPSRQGPRRGWVVGCAAASLVAVTAAIALAGKASPVPSPDQVLVTDGAGTVSLVDTTAGTTVYSVEHAVAAPDAASVYRTKPEGDATQVDRLDAANGSVVDSQVVDGALAIGVVSHDGGAVALLPRSSIGNGVYGPVARESTEITVVRADGGQPRTYLLDGNFEPETFSTDLDTLFLIEFWPATEPDRYFVRQLDLDSGELLVAYSPEVEWAPEMRGRARSHVMDPGGDHLYTLYSVEPGDPPIQDREDGTGGDNWSFVHVLDLHEEQSICIFLGDEFAAEAGDRLGMAVTPDGDTVYVVDAFSGIVVEIDTGRHRVAAMTTIEQLAGDGEYASRPQVAASADRLFVTEYGSTILEFERDGLALVDAMWTNRQINGLQLSPDASELRIAVPNQIVVYDLATDSEVATVTAPSGGDGTVDFSGSPPGVAGRFPLECAC